MIEDGTPSIDGLRRSLEGIMPAILVTCDAAGMPNVSLISQVHYVDEHHVALSYQFFNKTRRNLLATRRASVEIIDPVTRAQHHLSLDFLETRSDGPVFESMRAKLAGIASHSGMEGVFQLLGADIFRVREIVRTRSTILTEPSRRGDLIGALRRTCARLTRCDELNELLDCTLESLVQHFSIDHCMILMLDREVERFYTLATRGYAASGVGSEIMIGEGIIGMAARERVPIRINHMTADYRYGAAIREAIIKSGIEWQAATEIPFPGLEAPSSQVAVPILTGGHVFGVLFVESDEAMRYWHDDEDALVVVADVLGKCISAVAEDQGITEDAVGPTAPLPPAPPLTVRHFARDDSIFLGHDYLIKGVAGAILWRLLREHVATARVVFNTRELRLDPSLRLPQHAENLDARLVLLRKRLEEREAPIRLEKCGRGQLRLCIAGAVTLESAGDAAPQAHLART